MSYSNYEQTLIVNGYELLGVQSIDASYGISEKPIKLAGVGFVDALVDSPLQANVSVNRKMVSTDPLLEKNFLDEYLFDEQEFDGALLFKNKTRGIGFTKARLSRYTASCNVGEIPDVQTDFTVYGQFGENVLKDDSPNFTVDTNNENYPFSKSQSAPVIGSENDLHSVLDSTSLGSNWYSSSWFFNANIGESASFTEDLFFDNKSGWIYNKFWGWIYIALTGNNKKEFWFFSPSINNISHDNGMWFFATIEALGSNDADSNSFLYVDTNNSGIAAGWMEWFNYYGSEYDLVAYNHTSGLWYGLLRANKKFHLIDFELEISLPDIVQGNVPQSSIEENVFKDAVVYLSGKDVTNQWNDATLTISSIEYGALPQLTNVSSRGDKIWMDLGRDSFVAAFYNENLKTKEHPEIKYPDQSSMRVTVSDFTIDAISDFSYSRTINTQPIYALPKGNSRDWHDGVAGTKNLDPIQVDTQYPIETDINFTIIADTYQIREIQDRVQSAPKSNVTIEIFDALNPTTIINSFVGKNVRLVGESVNSTTEEEMSISLTYKGYEALHNNI